MARAEMKRAMDDPVIRPIYLDLMLLVARVLDIEVEVVEPEEPGMGAALFALRDTLGGDARNAETVMQLLIEAIQDRAPRMAHQLGPFLPQYLLARIEAALRGEVPDGLLPKKIWRFLPDNPVTIRSDGQPESIDWTSVTVKHFSQFQQYQRSLKPAARRGRKPKPTAATPAPEPSSRDRDHLARRAYAMRQDGQRWAAIAHALWPDEQLPSTSKGRDAVYQRVQRLVYRGGMLMDSSR